MFFTIFERKFWGEDARAKTAEGGRQPASEARLSGAESRFRPFRFFS